MDVDVCLFTFNFLQDLEADKRNLGRLVARQERELAKYVSTEADLPVILRLGIFRCDSICRIAHVSDGWMDGLSDN